MLSNLYKSADFFPIISFNSDSDAFARFFRVRKCLRSFFAAMGPICGKPSMMNCNCSLSLRKIFDARIESCFEEGLRAKTLMYFAVSFSLRLKIIGTWYSRIVVKRKPRKAFSCIEPE